MSRLTWLPLNGRPRSYGAATQHLGQRYSVIRVHKYLRRFRAWRDGEALGTFPTLADGKGFIEKLIQAGGSPDGSPTGEG